MFKLDVPFFLPLWRRIAVIIVAAGWGLFEISIGETIWGILFIAIACIAVWQFSRADWTKVAQEVEEG